MVRLAAVYPNWTGVVDLDTVNGEIGGLARANRHAVELV
jgi:hypothetical protein